MPIVQEAIGRLLEVFVDERQNAFYAKRAASRPTTNAMSLNLLRSSPPSTHVQQFCFTVSHLGLPPVWANIKQTRTQRSPGCFRPLDTRNRGGTGDKKISLSGDSVPPARRHGLFEALRYCLRRGLASLDFSALWSLFFQMHCANQCEEVRPSFCPTPDGPGNW